jgi:L,D-transpeptidase-like protein
MRTMWALALATVVSALLGSSALGRDDVGAGETARVPPSATPASQLSRDVSLSDERTETRWANAIFRGVIRTHPRFGARRIGRLRYLTENGYPEVYLLVAQHIDATGKWWVRVRLPGRPHGRMGWVARDALGPYRVARTFVLVDKQRLRLTVYRGRRVIFEAPVGIGSPRTPTPAGRFWIREKLRIDRIPWYGPRAIGTSAYTVGPSGWRRGGVVGLHGTDEPWLIPGRPSHGCIRLRNEDIVRLYRLIPRGTPVEVR